MSSKQHREATLAGWGGRGVLPFSQLVIFDYLHLRDYDQTTTDIPTHVHVHVHVHMTYVTNGCGLSLGLASPLLLITEAP